MSFPAPGGGPVVVRPGAPGRWAREAADAGWTVTAEPPAEPWALPGTIVRTADPEAAGLALARSAGVAPSGLSGDELAVLLDDARRVGATVWPPDEPPPSAGPDVDDETAALLGLLAEGRSVAEAARETHMSLRTAQRRLGTARTAFGVTTTAGAVAAWLRRAAP